MCQQLRPTCQQQMSAQVSAQAKCPWIHAQAWTELSGEQEAVQAREQEAVQAAEEVGEWCMRALGLLHPNLQHLVGCTGVAER